VFEQCFNERIKLLTMLSQKLLGFSVAVANDFPDFIVDSLRRFLAKRPRSPISNTIVEVMIFPWRELH